MNQYLVTAGSFSRTVSGNPMDVASEAFKLTGIRPDIKQINIEAPSIPVTRPATSVAEGAMDVVGRDRSQADRKVLETNGFSVAETVFERGSRVNSTGVENARKARLEYEAMDTTRDSCSALVAKVAEEKRHDAEISLSDLSMLEDGRLTRGGGRIRISERGFQQFAGRLSASLVGLGMPGLGGAGSYLRACPPALRAQNVNHWIGELRHVEDPKSREQVNLRTRLGKSGREAFAITSPSYTSYDADQIAKAVSLAAPASARGGVQYDGYKTRIEALFHTTVQPEHFVAGEFFRAGVIVSTDDTGSGSIRVQAVVFQNLCLNLIIIDRSAQETCRIRHVGSQADLVAAFQVGFRKALGKIDHFVRAWDVACEDQIVDFCSAPVEAKKPLTLREQIIEATILGILKQDLVPVVGRKEHAAKQVLRMWEEDNSGAKLTHDGLNRAALANAFTRYAHEVAAQENPWIEDEIQEAAGLLLHGAGQYRKIQQVLPA